MRYWHNDPLFRTITEDDFMNKEVTLHGFTCSYFRTPYSPSDPLQDWPKSLPTPNRARETESGNQFIWDLEKPVRLTCHAQLVEVVSVALHKRLHEVMSELSEKSPSWTMAKNSRGSLAQAASVHLVF